MLDIIVPVYNEADNILSLFMEIDEEIKSDKRVFVIYDFDEDNTLPIVVQHKEQFGFPITLVKNTIDRGVVNAIKTGFQITDSEYVLVMMADLSDRLDIVDDMYVLAEKGVDVVCGSRYMKGGKHYGGGLLKSLLSRMAGVSLHYLTRIPTHDSTNSFKMYSRKLIDSIDIESTGGFEIGLEITVKAYVNGYRVAEIPSEWQERTAGESNFHMWKWMPKYLKWYFYCIINFWRRCL